MEPDELGEQTQTIGKYAIVAELGRGGMGVVYKAWEESLQRFVAIKMLGDQLVNDENLVARFLREARSVADLNHPNVVQVFAVDTHEGRPYFAMEFVEGESLKELIRTSRKIDPKRALTLVREVGTGLSAAHDKGVVHRDIKPDNIMLTKHGGVKVVDFGIARVDDQVTKLTATGMAIGTPNYFSPEVCKGLGVDKRADIFSMGIVFYEMLTGSAPFSADSPLELMNNVVNAEIPDVTALHTEIDENVRMILYHMLEKKQEDRYQDFREVIADIDAYNAGQALHYASKAPPVATIRITKPAVAESMFGPTPSPRAASGSRAPLTVALVLVGLAAIAGAWWYLRQDSALPKEAVASTTVPGDTTARQEEDIVPLEDPVAAEESTRDAAPATAPADDTVPVQVGEQVVAASVENEPAREVAVASVEAPPAPGYSDPRLVVIVNGDPAVAMAIEAALESALADAAFSVMNEQYFDGYRPGSGMASLGKFLQENGADVAVIGDVRVSGRRDLEFYGRRDQQTTATLQVTAMLPAERRNLGAPWQQDIEYTAINASEQGRDAAAPIARDLIGRLNELKASTRRATK